MGKACVIQRLDRPGLAFLKISGAIDESFNGVEVAHDLSGDTILHLGRVSRFSSFGVREWVTLMRTCRGRLRHVLLVECAPPVVNQLNMVADFAAGAHVKSVQLPYACSTCHRDAVHTVDVDARRAELLAGQLPDVTCPGCKRPMTFDDMPDTYLAFLKDAEPPPAGSPLAAFIREFEAAAPEFADDGAGAQFEAPVPVSPALPPLIPVRQSVAPPAPAALAAPALPASVALAPPPPGTAPARAPSTASTSPGTGAAMAFWRELPPGARFAAVGAVGVLVLAAILLGRRGAEPTPAAAAAPGRRSVEATELLELNALVERERFDDAEAMIRRLGPVLTEESTLKLADLVSLKKQSAAQAHLDRARALAADGRHAEALVVLSKAAAIAGPSEEISLLEVEQRRKAGDCAGAVRAANDFDRTWPGSPLASRVAAVRSQCGMPSAAGRAAGGEPGRPKRRAEGSTSRRHEPAAAAARPASAPARPALSDRDILKVVVSHKPAVMACIKAHQQNNPASHGTVEMQWVVKGDGTTAQVRCNTLAFAGSALHECLAPAIEAWVFPAHGGADQVVPFPFRF